MTTELAKGIEFAYKERTDLMVFALTGRTGSGCSTAANILCKDFSDITLSEEVLVEPEKRKHHIVKDFVAKQWIPFTAITVSSVIYSFVLEEEWADVEKLLLDLKVPSATVLTFKTNYELIKKDHQFSVFISAVHDHASKSDKVAGWNFYTQSIEAKTKALRKDLGQHYQPVFQCLGDNIRFSGRTTKSTVDPNQLFTLMNRVRLLVAAAESAQSASQHQGTRIVIDAIRNPLELVYLRDHFAGLFVVAITTDDEVRRQRLIELGLTKANVDKLDEKEYGEKKHLSDYPAFVSQNIRDCIQKADIFVANPGKPAEFATSIRMMNAQLVRYIALALRPGLVTPTRDERCMQIAFVAKLNSGCISRQVGAVVTDESYSIQAIGWNDVPKGQVPCLLRNVDSLLSGNDDIAFSEFEKRDPKLRGHLQKTFTGRHGLKSSQGLSCPFCFKDAYNAVTKEKNQIHTRSLHAEENAFLQLTKRGSSGIAGGVVYTTASSCELCSKKAYQLGIKEIVYVDPYPGISGPHVLSSGVDVMRPKLRLFGGAVGHAYHRLYDSLLSIKDEYSARLSGDVQQNLPLKSQEQPAAH